MRNRTIKYFFTIALSLVMLIGIVGCSNEDNNNNLGSGVLSGNIKAGGSTSVEKAAKTALEEFVALNPHVTFEYDATGSSTGIKNVKDGTYGFGFSSRDIKEEEKEGIEYKTIALDGIALALNTNNGVDSLSLEQLKGIYTGEITNWSELGGNNADIVVVSRENGSGTRTAFDEIVGIDNMLTEKAIIKSGNGEVASYVSGEPNAIGYTSFVTLESNLDKIKGLRLDGVYPDTKSVQNHTYKLSRPFIIVYDVNKLNDVEKSFVDFLFTEDGQDMMEEAGVIRVK